VFFPVHHYYTRHHTWIRLIGRQDAYIGITDFAQAELGKITQIESAAEGAVIKKNDAFGMVYGSAKSTELRSPFDGKILITNPEILQSPWLINTDPYHHWIALISCDEDIATLLPSFFDPKAYRHAISKRK
jgi:glycine cleavage system H protein